MIPVPLDQIGFRWRDHKSALWWLGLLYRRPVKVQEILKGLSRWEGIKYGCLLFLHGLPYPVSIVALKNMVFGRLEDQSTASQTTEFLCYAIGCIFVVAVLIVFIIALRIAFDKSEMIIALVITVVLTFVVLVDMIAQADLNDVPNWIVFIILFPFAFAIIFSIIFMVVTAIIVVIDSGITGDTKNVIIMMIVIGIPTGIGAVIIGNALSVAAFLIVVWGTFPMVLLRFYYYPFHLLLLWPKPQVHWFRYHPVVWDDLCILPFINLHQLLVVYAESNSKGEDEIERLIANYPSQKREALRAKTILIARATAKLNDLANLDDVLARLPEGKKGFLEQTAQVREWGNEICLLQMRLDTISRPAYREPTIGQLRDKIETFRHRIAGLHEPLASEFRKAADAWLLIAERQLDEARKVNSKEKTTQVFRAGDPADRDSEAFAPRYGVVGELEQQIMLSTGCPGIVLYGRRRTGKSTILRNLTGFLPTEVIPVNASMQNPALFTSTEDFVGFISSEVNKQLGNLKVADLASADLTGLFRFLCDCNNKLEAEGKRLLLGVDEYETIDRKIGEGVFKTDLLDTVRESIQSHRRITWIFAGSHEITELVNAEWTSYLVSARTIEVPFFTPAETRLLLTDPLKYSSLWRNNPDKRPQFDPAFWGDAAHNCGIDRIQAEAAGWPHLVQLIAETIVDLINEEDADGVSPELMERALNKAIVRGHNVLHTLMRGESLLPGEWDYLSAFRDVAMQTLPTDRAVIKSLRRRLLIEENGGQWQLRVPLMARWLKVRGE